MGLTDNIDRTSKSILEQLALLWDSIDPVLCPKRAGFKSHSFEYFEDSIVMMVYKQAFVLNRSQLKALGITSHPKCLTTNDLKVLMSDAIFKIVSSIASERQSGLYVDRDLIPVDDAILISSAAALPFVMSDLYQKRAFTASGFLLFKYEEVRWGHGMRYSHKRVYSLVKFVSGDSSLPL